MREEGLVEISELHATVKGFFQGLRHVLFRKRPMASQKAKTDGGERKNYDAGAGKPAGKASSFPGTLFSVGPF
jgi:hypothetical protein